ncbi:MULTISPECIES: MarR family transcriptional regulator [Bacillaceae]|uniref:MarR family winged helix-turn-helix transcriptional regulator n=1 Tax=Bacillaceae TaxID=186817 RepID=UPI000E734149|nr:MarR family transcriptional regulator [Bacillus sp. PK3_68]RJS62331.1 MarR family transcriptional regulator [Bacillus sp. PK3_68]
MNQDSLQSIEYEIALLVRLTTAQSPKLGSLDRSEYLLLSELDENGPLGINVLAEKLLLNISTASRQVSTLEAKNYIVRYPDPQNGRISLLEITQEGQKILHKVQKARFAAYAEVLHDWTKEELEELDANLTRLNRDFKKWRK